MRKANATALLTFLKTLSLGDVMQHGLLDAVRELEEVKDDFLAKMIYFYDGVRTVDAIKAVRVATGWVLKQSKDFVDEQKALAPCWIMVPRELTTNERNALEEALENNHINMDLVDFRIM